jgi:hypothetical protein
VEAAGVGGYVFGFGARVFPAVKGADGINYTDGFAVGIVSQPGTGIREFATGAAADAPARTAFGDGQKGGYGSLYFGGPGVFGGCFYFSNSHN